ncbi:MAG: hypothetical protein K9N47_19775 [Prosthecobacter sp.]|uniref:hypothetical protein n=1 Tax=Prosthecobacter sp. TaxID=1965333 RepID=UPI0025FBA6C2|nr:hypothetical protein [Prosthecobacter sp.]MCF7788370.1 hypothetical protein [Prosthecobacter sp.]
MEDLVILTPDSAYKQVLPAILARHQALGIRSLTPEIVSDPYHDSSDQAVELLRAYQSTHRRALMVRDIEGSGREELGAAALERHLHQQLMQSGWQSDHTAVLVLEPELESWLRFGSSHMGMVLKELARKNRDKLADWETKLEHICAEHGGMNELGKPLRPKEVFRDLLKEYNIPPSNAVLGKLAEKESLQACRVPSFVRFRELMQQWFPAS